MTIDMEAYKAMVTEAGNSFYHIVSKNAKEAAKLSGETPEAFEVNVLMAIFSNRMVNYTSDDIDEFFEYFVPVIKEYVPALKKLKNEVEKSNAEFKEKLTNWRQKIQKDE